MKVGVKLICSLLFLVLIIVVSGYVITLHFDKASFFSHNVLLDNTRHIEKITRLNSAAKYILFYDEVLTQSARNYAYSGDPRWIERYNQTEPLLVEKINFVIQNGDHYIENLFKELTRVNQELVRLEKRSIDFVNNNQKKNAIALLDGKTYQSFKENYTNILQRYNQKISDTLQKALAVNVQNITTHTAHNKNRVETSEYTVIGISVLALIVALFLGLFLTISISNPLQELKEKTHRISEGDFDTNLVIKSHGELQELAQSFTLMTQKLKTAIANEKKAITLKARAEAQQRKADELNALNRQLRAKEKSLEQSNKELEKHKQLLAEQVKKLEKNNQSMMGREKRIIELKKAVAELRKRLNTNNEK
jgi:methyl-accepting chemotaxis protein